MTSGIPSHTNNDPFMLTFSSNNQHNWSPSSMIDVVLKSCPKPTCLNFNPGTRWEYSNTNAVLAGMIISNVTGHTLEQEMSTRFLGPNNSTHLSLPNTFYIPGRYPKNIATRMVHGYAGPATLTKRLGVPIGTDTTDWSLSWAGAAGALVSNSQDVANWVLALFTPGKVLQPEQFKELTDFVTHRGQPVIGPTSTEPFVWGLGGYWNTLFKNCPVMYQMAGQTAGYMALWVYDTTTNTVISITTNASADALGLGPDAHILALAMQAYAIVNPKTTCRPFKLEQ